jgi:hypothetical protein
MSEFTIKSILNFILFYSKLVYVFGTYMTSNSNILHVSITLLRGSNTIKYTAPYKKYVMYTLMLP